MHRGDGQDQKRHRTILAEPVKRPRHSVDRNRPQHRPQHQRGDDISLVPENHALYIISSHAGVVHRRNTKTQDDATGFHQHAASGIGGNAEAGGRRGNGDKKRESRQIGIVTHLACRGITQHRHKMGGPYCSTAIHARQKQPIDLLEPGRQTRPRKRRIVTKLPSMQTKTAAAVYRKS